MIDRVIRVDLDVCESSWKIPAPDEGRNWIWITLRPRQ
jgi:hypothetical protein